LLGVCRVWRRGVKTKTGAFHAKPVGCLKIVGPAIQVVIFLFAKKTQGSVGAPGRWHGGGNRAATAWGLLPDGASCYPEVLNGRCIGMSDFRKIKMLVKFGGKWLTLAEFWLGREPPPAKFS